MTDTILTQDIEVADKVLELETTNQHLQERVHHLEAQVNWFKEQFRLSQHRQFGSSSEKISALQSELLFNEAEDEQICTQCGGHLHEMSTQVREEFEFIPAQVKVIRQRDQRPDSDRRGCPSYNDVKTATLIGCWAHARRKFFEAFVDDIKEWLGKESPLVLPQSKLGQAFTYCRNQWPKLIQFLEDGRLEPDNNRAERSIKPFVIGRKNWLFANTPRGAKTSAIVYSIVETAKENGLNPFDYLKYLFERIRTIDPDDHSTIDLLLPWNEAVQAELRIQQPYAAANTLTA